LSLAKSYLAVLAALADLLHVHLEIWPGEQPPSRIDAPSLILIAVISFSVRGLPRVGQPATHDRAN
jgi:hypothetical protein